MITKYANFPPRFGIKELRLKSGVFISLVFIYLNLNLRLFNYLLFITFEHYIRAFIN